MAWMQVRSLWLALMQISLFAKIYLPVQFEKFPVFIG